MNCLETHPLLDAYADGELDLVTSMGIEQHLRECPDCAAAVRRCRAFQAAVQKADLRYRTPAALRARIRATVPARARRNDPVRFRLWQWLAVGASAAAAVVLLLHPILPSAHDRLLDDAIASHVRSLMADHLTDVASTDQHTVKPWFAGRIDFTPPVKDLAAQGFPLVGGRLDYLAGRPVAALVYRHNRHLINVFIWPGPAGAQPWVTQRRGYSIVERKAGDLHVCAVSDLNLDELKQLAALLAE